MNKFLNQKRAVKHLVPKFFRLQVALPLLVVAAMVLAVISEVTYQRAEKTVTGSIKLTAVRLGVAKLLQLLTDAETAQRGFLLTGNPAYLQPLRLARQQFDESTLDIELIASAGSTGPADAATIRQKVAAKFAELDQTVAMAASGDRSKALELVRTDAGKQLMDELREIFRRHADEAALLQQRARVNIFAALMFNRIAVVMLALILAIGICLHLVQMRALEKIRKDYQQSLEKSVADKTTRLAALATWLESAREDEKSHLARELHDELGGLLTGAKLTMARMQSKLAGNPEMLERIASVNLLLNDGIALKRRIIEDLRPSTLSLLGLRGALEALCGDASRQMGIPVDAAVPDIKVSPVAELALFRVVQEALTNIGKYANASRVTVQLMQVDENIHLKITDNGTGFTASAREAGKHGLTGMRFRLESHSGTFLIGSAPGQGTRIVATLPVSAGTALTRVQADSMPAALSAA